MRSGTIVICILLFAMMFLVVVPVQADDIPTVTIGEHKVNPSVLMPGSLGTITITVNNTASSASVTQETGHSLQRRTPRSGLTISTSISRMSTLRETG